MANNLINNTIFVQEASATALPWPSKMRVQSVIFYALDTTAAATFVLSAGSPMLQFSLITQSSMGGAVSIPATHSVFFGGVDFPVAWIPTTLTACSAWIHLA